MKKMVLRLTALLLAMLLVVPVSATAVVRKHDLSVNDFSVVMPDHLVYDGTAKNVQVTVKNDYGGTIIVRYNGSEEAPVNAGEYVVTLECGGDAKYTELKETELARFTIEKAVPEVEVPTGLAATLDDPLESVELPAGWTFDAGQGTKIGGSGVYNVTYTPADTLNYECVHAQVTIAVHNRPLIQYTPPTNLVYDGKGKPGTYKPTPSDYKGTVTLRYNGSTEIPVNAGTYVVTAECAGDGKYAPSLEAKVGEFTILKATPNVKAPAGLTASVGQTLANVKLPEGWAWDDAPTTSVGAVGDRKFTATYTPADTRNYKEVRATLTIAVRNVPATGDSANLTVLLAAMMLAGAAMLVLRRRVRG